MELERNIFIAEKLLAELIYNHAYIEGCNVTFPETQTILDGMKINNVSVNDIQTVINLRDAYRYILSNIGDFSELTLENVCKINENVSRNESLEWGVLRTGEIGISGTLYKPEVPVEEEVFVYL